MPDGEVNSLSQLIRVRGSIKHKLTTLEKFIDSIKASEPDQAASFLTNAELRLKNSESILHDFENIQLKIEIECEETEIDNHYMERENFETRYFTATSFLGNFIEIHKKPTNIESSISESRKVDPLQNIILPKIKLLTFKGDFENWLEFRTSYLSTIHNNSSLNNSQKYQLLRASLEGYAKRLIDQVEFTDNHYDAAWGLLCERFDKKHFLVDNHLKAIFNVEQIQKESAVQFRQLLDTVSKHLIALQGLKLSKEQLWDFVIIQIISGKLDRSTYRNWKEFRFEGELPSLDEFLDFLKSKADVLETLQKPDYAGNSTQGYKHYKQRNSQITLVNNNTNMKCNFCKGQHSIYNCSDFLKLDVASRIEAANKFKLCRNCLRTGHTTEKCYLSSCRKCKEKHNTLLHAENNSNSNSDNNKQETSTNLFIKPNEIKTQVLLSTVTFYVRDSNGVKHLCRGLLDSGAQSNLVRESFCKKLNIPLLDTKLSIVGINQVVSNLNKKCTFTIISKYNNFQTSVSCYAIPSICNDMPVQKATITNWNIPDNMQLSDDLFYEPGEIDVLIGANLFWDLLVNGKVTLGKGLPTLQNTKLGWVVSGTIPVFSTRSICNFSREVNPEDEQLKKFWEVEEISCTPQLSNDEQECENNFHDNVSRNNEGKFIVKFPLKHPVTLLGDSYNNALKRFLHLEKRFLYNPNLKSEYGKFIQEYISLGHMFKLEQGHTDHSDVIAFYLPHHGVIKESSLSTKLRVVFDGSCPSNSGWSLNDLQYIGPKIQNDIISILLRFRIYKYVVSADIMKMYRQVIMHASHQPLQRIIWRDNPTDEFSVYQLSTVTYGTTSAPYLAIKCLQTLAQEYSDKYPLASKIILRDFYVDDLLTGANDSTELATICQQICAILTSGGFLLRKWISNYPDILNCINTSNDSLGILRLGEHDCSKTLGLKWFSHSDVLRFDTSIPNLNDTESVTKREMLSSISTLYDPCGLVSPCIIYAKIMIQNLWSMKLAWDEPLPIELFNKWKHFREELVKLNQLEIPRNAVGYDCQLVDIHCFSDASKEAYAACIYLRSINSKGEFNVSLLCSKTKVAPIKPLTTPRLELCAALLSAQLASQVKSSLLVEVPYYFWSDSQVVLHWLNTEPTLLEVFVANRVSKIQDMTNICSWNYVNTKINPADIASRGIFPNKLKSCTLWWHGPEYLYKSQENWPQYSFKLPEHEVPEFKRKKIKVLLTCDSFDLFNKFSNLHKLKRVAAFCLRFIHNTRFKNSKRIGCLSVAEINDAYHRLIKFAQKQSFSDAISVLTKNKTLPPKHRLSSLTPFLDDKGILRVGGRLMYTSLNMKVKHPILLSSSHDLTKLIFRHKHNQLLHPGPQLLLFSVRQDYWTIGGRVLAKKTVRSCITCFKCNPVPATAPMGKLPDHRVSPGLPFQIVGIDYAGPFSIKDRKGRGCKITKSYICVFVCFISKAVHLELLSDMSTTNFLACLKRFTSRRGVPNHIYSDNGTTFRGAHNELRFLGQFLERNQKHVTDYAISVNIEWHFTPPYSPNFGGLWEAAVKSMKHHLRRTMMNTILTYEEFVTLLTQIEGILNSRPLYAMSNDPTDYDPITPSHFLIGRSITSIPSCDLRDIPEGRLTRYQHIQQLQQKFWSTFSKEYIGQLHQSYKWKSPAIQLKTGALVLVKNENLPPQKWNLGRIHQLIPGKDGVNRVAVISTASGTFKRSIRHLCPLPLETDIV